MHCDGSNSTNYFTPTFYVRRQQCTQSDTLFNRRSFTASRSLLATQTQQWRLCLESCKTTIVNCSLENAESRRLCYSYTNITMASVSRVLYYSVCFATTHVIRPSSVMYSLTLFFLLKDITSAACVYCCGFHAQDTDRGVSYNFDGVHWTDLQGVNNYKQNTWCYTKLCVCVCVWSAHAPVCVCVCVCARARVCVCARARTRLTLNAKELLKYQQLL